MAWCIYDWACSAFASIITTFIFATYFTRKVAPNEIIGTAEWGHAIALAGFLIALGSPLFGAIADHKGRRKPWLFAFTSLSIVSTALLWFAEPNLHYVFFTLACVVLGTLGFEISMVFYNAFLPDLVPRNYIGRISGWGWGLGYAGGLCCLSIALFGFVQLEPAWLESATSENIRICGPLAAAWMFLFSLPLFIFVPDRESEKIPLSLAIKRGLSGLFRTIKSLPKQKNIFRYLVAHMIYIDGLNTIFSFGGIYAAGTFGMSISEVVQFGIVANIFAGLGAAVFAWVDDKIGAKPTILFSLFVLIVLATGLLLVNTKTGFWILALSLSIFVGPVQAASRSLMTRLAPPQKIAELFGLYAFSGKATAFIGPWLLAIVTLIFGSQRAGLSTVLLFFIAGIILLWNVVEPEAKHP